MKAKIVSVIMLILVGFSGYAQSLSGKEMFEGNCKACHSIGGGDLVGPDLAGVTERRDRDWTRRFINNSQEMVKAGDETAVELFNKYNKIAMPSHKFSDDDLEKLISYMEEAGHEAAAANQEVEAEVMEKETDNADLSTAEAGSGGSNLIVNLILGVLGISAIILSGIAVYLIRIIRS